VIEIRHYVNRAGKDVFDDWLTQLADARAQAKIATRINRLAAGNFGDCKALRQGLTCYESIGDQVTVCITRWQAGSAFCSSAAVTNESRLQTLFGHWNISRITRKGVETHETQN